MASSSKRPYNNSFTPDRHSSLNSNSTSQDNSSDVSLPLQYDTEEDLNQVFISIEEELKLRTEMKWKLSLGSAKGSEKDKESLLRKVMNVSITYSRH